MKKIFTISFLASCISLNFSYGFEPKTDRTYPEVIELFEQLQSTYRENVELFELATSNEGTPIIGAKIGHGPTSHLLVSNHHGNEYGAGEVALGFANHLAQYPIEQVTVYIIPVLNTWGYDRRNRHELAGGSYVDPNRDYPGPCKNSSSFRLNSTSSLSDFLHQKNIVSAATLHTSWPAVVYPWGHSTHDTETQYEETFQELSLWSTVESEYTTGNATEVIYPADGTFEDYAFWQHGVWSLLFELGHSHTPSMEALDRMIQTNIPGLRRLFTLAPKVRADLHNFTGQCDSSLRALDLGIE